MTFSFLRTVPNLNYYISLSLFYYSFHLKTTVNLRDLEVLLFHKALSSTVNSLIWLSH